MGLRDFVFRLALVVMLAAATQRLPSAPRPLEAALAQQKWQGEVRARLSAAERRVARTPDGAFRIHHRKAGVDLSVSPDGVAQAVLRGPVPGGVSLRLDGPRGEAKLGDCDGSGAVDEVGHCLVRLDIRRPGLTEWWRSTAQGPMHGFTVEASYPRNDDSLELKLRLTGGVAQRVAGDEGAVEFVAGTGHRLRYAKLEAWDELGKPLKASMLPEGELVRLKVETRGARFPITVDPLMSAVAPWTADGEQILALGDINGDGYDDFAIGAYGYQVNPPDRNGRVYVYHGSPTGPAMAPNWVYTSPDIGIMGRAIAGAGDVNGDGFDDVVIGDCDFNSLQGKVLLFMGSASGLSMTPAWTKTGEGPNDAFGISVASAGDVNRDGFSDVIIGADSRDNTLQNQGAAYLYLGSATGLATTHAWYVEGDQADAQMGLVVSSAGDVNGDGYGDVIVSADNYSNGQDSEGAAFVYHGTPTGLTPTHVWLGEGNQDHSGYGESLAGVGDVNGDGYSDVLVGAYDMEVGFLENSEGWLFAYYGSPSGLSTTASWTFEANQRNAFLGRYVSAAGDVNGDGYADVMAAAHGWDNDLSNEGRIFLFLGSNIGLGAEPAWTFETDQVDGRARASHGIGDVNGDGYGDIIVGAQEYDLDVNYQGRVWLFYGSATGLSPNSISSSESNQAGAQLGLSMASAGDVNGDGLGDVVVGAPNFDNGHTDEGRALLYLGTSTGLPATAAWSAESNQTGAGFGTSVGSAGDVNGDGYGDVIVGVPRYDNGQVDEGRALVYLGGSSGLAVTPAWTFESNQVHAQLGTSVASAGDVNGDGLGDVLVGAPYFDSQHVDEGRVLLYVGSPTGLGAGSSWAFYGGQAGARAGHAVARAGDVNGDGFDDVIIGLPGYSGGQANEGRAVVFHGSSAGLAATPAWTAEADQANAGFGVAVSGAGDVNGDGFSDVIVGAPHYDNGQEDEGRAQVYLGRAMGLATTPAWSAEGEQSGASFGFSVASAGDTNLDGYAEVMVGAPRYDNGQDDEGRVQLFSGGPMGLETSSSWSAEGNQAGAYFGAALAGQVDINGDGYSDVVVGAPLHDNGENDEGRFSVYFGNGAEGSSPRLSRPMRAVTAANAPLAPGAVSGTSSFAVRALTRAPMGRARARLVVEAKPLGQAFNGSGLSFASTFTEVGTATANLTQQVTVAQNQAFRWRARLRYQNSFGPVPQPTGHWRLGGVMGEAKGVHLRTSNGRMCTPSASSDTTCDGVDDDCNFQPDEEAMSMPTSCGTGLCVATGVSGCFAGVVRDTCIALPNCNPDAGVIIPDAGPGDAGLDGGAGGAGGADGGDAGGASGTDGGDDGGSPESDGGEPEDGGETIADAGELDGGDDGGTAVVEDPVLTFPVSGGCGCGVDGGFGALALLMLLARRRRR